MKKKPRVRRFRIIAVLTFILALSVIGWGWYRFNLRPISPHDTRSIIFVVPKGQAISQILTRLRDEKVIRSAIAARGYLLLTRNEGALQAGSFRLKPSMSAPEIVEELKHGTLDIWVTVPEGWRSEQIIDQLIEKGYFPGESRTDLSEQFRQSEGKLFPDTYLFPKDATAAQIIDRMTATFQEKTAGLSVTSDQLILASLVEREAKRDEDRPLIAGVLLNRLRIGMALQVDSTLQYARATQETGSKPSSRAQAEGKQETMTDWWEPISPSDKNIDSPYNTYKFPGLPPGPIANPGLSSIKAVLSPTSSSYLYYVSEPDGTTHYAETLQGHNINIEQHL